MGRRKTHAPLNVFINNRHVGRLEKETSGAIQFRYDSSWLEWANCFPVSLSLPLRTAAYRGEAVVAVFDNLLPDNPSVRRQVAEKTGAQGADVYSLLEQIGRDCVPRRPETTSSSGWWKGTRRCGWHRCSAR